MKNDTFTGQLEIDYNRGVIYFHATSLDNPKIKVPTLLRICQLKGLPKFGEDLVDITVFEGMMSGKNTAKRINSPLKNMVKKNQLC